MVAPEPGEAGVGDSHTPDGADSEADAQVDGNSQGQALRRRKEAGRPRSQQGDELPLELGRSQGGTMCGALMGT